MASVPPSMGAGKDRPAMVRLRPRRPRTRRGTALLVGSLLALALIAPVAAAEFLNGDSPRVPRGTTVSEDLYVAGREVEIAGTVTRDLLVMAGDLSIADSGRVDGNVNAAVDQATIAGEVGRSLRVAARDVTIVGTVGGDVVVAGATVEIERGASVAGDVIVAGGEVEILGDVGGDVRGSAGSVVIDATIDGDVRLDSDDIELRSDARIGGRLEYTSADEAEIDQGAIVTGGVDRDEPERFGLEDGLVGWLTGVILRLLWLLVAGAVLILLLPRGCVAVADGVRHRPLGSLLYGLLFMIVTPILIVILLVTVVGLPVALIGLAAYLAALYLSQVVVGLAIGRFILPNRWGDEGRGFNLLAMTIGVLIIAGLRLIPLPFVSEAIALIVAVFGLGAIVLGPRLRKAAPPHSPYGYAPY